MQLKNEVEFENNLISTLATKGWESEVLRNYSEDDLIKNWADILFNNNREVDKLNNYPLTNSEMQQIIDQIKVLKTPLKLNQFINGKTASIIRDNPEDVIHFGKTVSLNIYDRMEISAGRSRYQIVQQPKFTSQSNILNNRRGDLMLLINGMPVIHIELKRSGVHISQAYNQIEKYSYEGIFSGLFSLIQIFVAMTPEETVYFANPGQEGRFNQSYYFHWADVNNEPINNWKDIAKHLLSIPMAHQMIGFYTVADKTDGVLKVMRSYQYYASSAISDKVAKISWNESNQLGGYIWHTTGSGKTMTSFKSAQLIANSKEADKVVFLMDRIELGTQSLLEYNNFTDDNEEVQSTKNTYSLITKLKSDKPLDTLIVTSIQKMSNIKEEGDYNANDIQVMNKKRIVFIIDECHRSTFGEMLTTIKNTFPYAIFFGFTGTPIHEENQKKMNTTSTVFGDELHRYSIADGIRDKNVLGFDPYKVLTYRDKDLRRAVALEESKAETEEDAIADPKKSVVYYKFMKELPMSGYTDDSGKNIKGIEDYIPDSQYKTTAHQSSVVEDITQNWITLSHNYKFHAIFATSSIKEAIEYYRLIKKSKPELKVTCQVDPNIDNVGDFKFKEDGLVEIVEDYNKRYDCKFTLATYSSLKKDIALRLAHKELYLTIEKKPGEQVDLLIVVNQMLTGFDSKWINTLYVDKMLEYENIIQAFSRTNRIFGPEKPFGTIRYYRKPHTMENEIKAAVKLYSGDKSVGLFVQKLEQNLNKMNSIYSEISELFAMTGIVNFEKLPDDISERGKFASLFKTLTEHLEAVKIQGFSFSKLEYEFHHDKGKHKTKVIVAFDENTYLILALRYKELTNQSNGTKIEDIPFNIDGYLTEIDTGVIDANYMNSRFEKYIKSIATDDNQLIGKALEELHKSFATLTQEEQRYATIFIHDIQRGDVNMEEGKTIREHITEYQNTAKNNQMHSLSTVLGIDIVLLKQFMLRKITEKNINDFGKFEELKNTVDRPKAKSYFESIEKVVIPQSKANIKTDELLRKFIIVGGFDIDVTT